MADRDHRSEEPSEHEVERHIESHREDAHHDHGKGDHGSQVQTAQDQVQEAEEGPSDFKHSAAADEAFVKEHSFSAFKVVMITLGVIVGIGIILAGIGGYYIYSQLQPVNPDSDEIVEVEIPMGSSVPAVASILKEHGLIHHEDFFYYYMRYQGTTDFQAGHYEFSPSMHIDEMVEMLQSGQISKEPVSFTIPEGWTVEQIAARLDEEQLVDEEEFLRVVNEGDFSDIPFVEDIPDVEEREYRLEGFLYPETYQVHEGAGEDEIIGRMLRQFEEEFEAEWLEEVADQDLDLYETVTLASIIEREAVVDEERPIISGVFHNRLEADMLLQSCATIMFFLEDVDDIMRLTLDDLEEEHPYNTYLHEELPPGPIANAGKASLEAAVYPQDHDYQFFVIKNDGSNEHHFAETYEQHQQNDALSRGNLPSGNE